MMESRAVRINLINQKKVMDATIYDKRHGSHKGGAVVDLTGKEKGKAYRI